MILSDDQGWGDLSLHGNNNLATPNLDALGREGAVFTHFYVCAVCAPTRAEFLTGRYHARSGVRGVSTGAERMNADEVTIADTFRAAGYATAIFGKWHNGSQHPYHPNARGFDEFYGFTEGHWGHYFDWELDHNGQLVRGKGYLADDMTDRAMAWIEQQRNRPFFCYLAYNIPHSPMQVPDRFWEKFARFEPKLRVPQEEVAMTRAALAMCENLDWNVGRILRHLKRLGLDRDTIVIFFSDNGPNSWRWNGGMKGRKGSLDEGGLRAPLLIRWPAKIRAGTRVDRIAGAIDLLPTLADLCDVPLISRKPLDGLSLRPLLSGTSSSWPDRMIFSLHNGRVSLRTQYFRLDPWVAFTTYKRTQGSSTTSAASSRSWPPGCARWWTNGPGKCCPWWVPTTVPSPWAMLTSRCFPPGTAFPRVMCNVVRGRRTALISPTGSVRRTGSVGTSKWHKRVATRSTSTIRLRIRAH